MLQVLNTQAEGNLGTLTCKSNYWYEASIFIQFEILVLTDRLMNEKTEVAGNVVAMAWRRNPKDSDTRVINKNLSQR